MHKYEIIIYWSNEDGVFVGEVPELPGCMAHGEYAGGGVEVHRRSCGVVDRDGA